MALCARHIGDTGDFEPYSPCGQPAPYEVNRPVFGGGSPFWMACRDHAIEARGNGCRVEGLDDEDDFASEFYARRRLIIARMYERARVALGLAYRYRAEDAGALRPTTTLARDRVRDCVMQVRAIRDAIRVQRGMRPEDADTVILVTCANDL